MSRSLITLAEKVKLLFDKIKRPDGKQFTYDYLKNMTEIEPSTVSRIRSGQNQDPSFMSIIRLARAFDVSLDYFAADMTDSEAQTYLKEYRNSNNGRSYFDELRANAQQRSTARVESLALRASHLDSEALEAVEMMVNYVLKQKGVPVPDGSIIDEEVSQKSDQGKIDIAVPNLRNV